MGDDEALFSISDIGVITFNSEPDYEDPIDSNEDNVYNITVIARDNVGNSSTQDITITVIDVDDTPPVFNNPKTAEVVENTTEALITLDVYDETLPISYILGGYDNDLFELNTTTMEITFKNPPDFENPLDNGGDNVYNFNVEATDALGNSAKQYIVITVTNIDDTPPVFNNPKTATSD